MITKYITVYCANCGAQRNVPDESIGRSARCANCGQIFPITNNTNTSNDSHVSKNRNIQGRNQNINEYALVPWYRKSIVACLLLMAIILTKGYFPGALFVCIIVFTGDVYEIDKQGKLMVWGSGNKYAAVILVVLHIIIFVFRDRLWPQAN